KSKILKQYADLLVSLGVSKENIIELNLENLQFEDLKDYHKLNEYILSRVTDNKDNYYVFIDEIQEVYNYERVINSLNLMPNVDIYITGSNAYFLSGEFATYLSGRYIEIPVYTLSFAELSGKNSDELSLYLQQGGYPYIRTTNISEELKQDYLRGIYNTVVLKDVVQRKRVNDVDMLKSVAKFLSNNIGNLTSVPKIANSLTSYGRKTNPITVENYISGLVDALLFYRVSRYDIKGKESLRNLNKYYICDIGLRNYVLSNKITDYGFLLENVVFLELKRRGYEVSVGKINDLEVDFVASKRDGEVEYIQVSLTVRDQTTLERELKPMQKIRDSYPKKLITLDNDPYRIIDGIPQIYLLDWLIDY
ncbi:MAG: ATP-binding protein, partial [Candidatus Ancillula sp.]|nr:ATP-binding protein [Candidatus Ancillula sp.]